MIVSIIMSVAGLGVACMGMKCTTCGGDDKTRKSRIAMTGGIVILIGGQISLGSVVLFFFIISRSEVYLVYSCSFVRHRCLFLVCPWHHPSLLQPFYPRQYQVSNSTLMLSGNMQPEHPRLCANVLPFFLICPSVPLKVWVWFCHLHCLGWSLPDCSGRCHAGSILPKREVYTQISHVQTPQQQRVCVNGTLVRG